MIVTSFSKKTVKTMFFDKIDDNIFIILSTWKTSSDTRYGCLGLMINKKATDAFTNSIKLNSGIIVANFNSGFLQF